MAPCDDQNLPPWLAYSGQLADELGLVRHMLTTLHRPNEVKLPIPEGLMKGICYLVIHFAAQALTLGYTVGSFCLQRRQADDTWYLTNGSQSSNIENINCWTSRWPTAGRLHTLKQARIAGLL